MHRLATTLLVAVIAIQIHAGDRGALKFQSLPSSNSHFAFSGPIGDRVDRNVDEWLLRAPLANPGMLEMFRVRDRSPTPQLVPWAGEFVGKYLLSAIQALRMSDDPRLRAEVESVIKELISTQAEDGYLGPFPKKDRLRGNWDLWGHYHIIEALLMWHEQSGDTASLTAARRAADLICNTFLNTKLRVHDAGSHEMNMAIITALGHLYRLTNEPRYLAMMREVEKDWERAGDYLRAGVKKIDFYKTPSPRWESLHDLQGLLELYRITGEQKYRDAFEHHWRSIARSDIHNTGGFSSGEQATGNPYAPGAIETCCTIAWTALSIDMLRLTGDPQIAEYLERATFNASLGAQHPSGRWWTYNTPMDGIREASAHTIVFQSRAGTPELNCCSVNGPRALGMLSEWAVMHAGDTLVINSFLPGKYKLRDGAEFEITGNYPLSNDAEVKWIKAPNQPITVKHRSASGYAETKSDQSIKVHFDLPLRVEHGAREATNRASIYRGPLLLAYDQALNTFDEKSIPPVTEASLQNAKIEIVYDRKNPLTPWLQVTLTNGLRLCDFAGAGARGTRYKTWLRTKPITAAPDGLLLSAPSEAEAAGSNSFTYSLEEFPDADFSVSLRVKLLEIPTNRLAQIFSAWAAGGDDPLRLVLDKGKLHARIENSAGGSSTEGIVLTTNEWHRLLAVKRDNRLHLYINGVKRGETSAPANLVTASRTVALGGNPLYTGGNEYLRAQFAEFKFYARALTPEEISVK
ncbi:MAG TPA: beta-L-arabinofuranosidase domain-containing protein [Verrucomicrobiae bacterium]|nr:beta-L-arabinofuranosidase domain-containing protein [Verrucomicrobiae bacterium]